MLRQLKLVQSCPWAHNASALGQYRYPPPQCPAPLLPLPPPLCPLPPPMLPQMPPSLPLHALPQPPLSSALCCLRLPHPAAPHPSPPHREQLRGCCNASAKLVLTRDNTPLGSQIVYDGEPAKKYPVKEELLEMLPQGAPYECCAVVGNGGILRNSSCGPEIDRAQFVIRFNLPPMDFADDVGTKSSIVTMNPSILHARFRGLSRWRRPFAEAVGTYGAPLLLIPAFSFAAYTAVSSQALYTLEDFGSPARAVFMNPEYLAGLDGHWRSRGLRVNRLSSGFMLVSAALELCQHLTLYGFWPFPTDPEGQPLIPTRATHYGDEWLENQRPSLLVGPTGQVNSSGV
uniref:ST8 alpha-N-acetyl-neuraminide alpha-2,8-sialyltransferase 6 n=1 Tax=Terrapene triunguis TaxID=2587831 RepID=A0A674IC23_9SAUR